MHGFIDMFSAAPLRTVGGLLGAQPVIQKPAFIFYQRLNERVSVAAGFLFLPPADVGQQQLWGLNSASPLPPAQPCDTVTRRVPISRHRYDKGQSGQRCLPSSLSTLSGFLSSPTPSLCCRGHKKNERTCLFLFLFHKNTPAWCTEHLDPLTHTHKYAVLTMGQTPTATPWGGFSAFSG